MSARFKQRLPFALLFALIVGIGFSVADTSSPWQLWMVGIAALIVFSIPEIVGWIRKRRSAKGDGSEPVARS
jgi:hypothetical protein